MATDSRMDLVIQQRVWVGLDLAKKRFEAAIALNSPTFPTRGFPTTQTGIEQLLVWCDQLIANNCPGATLGVVMEATGSTSLNVLAWLYQLRPESAPAIVNPHYIKAYADSLGTRNKTDKADAQVIARFGRERNPAGEKPKTPTHQRLQELAREREFIVEQRTAEKNRLKEPCSDPDVLKMRKQRVAAYDKQIKQIEKLMRVVLDKDPDLKHDVTLLDTIPGVGFVVAVTVVAELGDLRRFETPRKLVGFCGVSPRQHTSGTSVHRQSRMCKKGNKHVRPMLHLAARSLINKPRFALGRYYEHLLSRGKSKCAAIAAVGRKLLVLMHAVLKNNRAYDERLATCGKPGAYAVENLMKSAPAA